MKQSTVSSKTMAIKATVYNQIRKDLFKKINPITPGAVTYAQANPKFGTFFTDKEKIALFDKWFNLNGIAHYDLNAYKRKRKEAKAIHEQRLKSDWYDKKLQKARRHIYFSKETPRILIKPKTS